MMVGVRYKVQFLHNGKHWCWGVYNCSTANDVRLEALRDAKAEGLTIGRMKVFYED
jgi:hypothetical protein